MSKGGVMSKGKIIVIGVLVSLIVPLIRVLSILKDNWEMEVKARLGFQMKYRTMLVMFISLIGQQHTLA